MTSKRKPVESDNKSNGSNLNPDPRPDRKTFDAVLKRLLDTPPLPRVKVRTGKKKLNKVLER